MRAACAQAGLDSAGATLMRLGENALFKLAGAPVVVRVARTMAYWDDAAKEASVSRWLAASKIPAAQLYGDLDQPMLAAGHPVTLWRFLPGRVGGPDDVATLAGLLRQVHALPRPADFDLPAVDILGRVDPRIEAAFVPAEDKAFLLGRTAEIRAALRGLAFPLAVGPIHGDAHVQNVIFSEGTPTLLDFERFAFGQPEWDLSMTATEYRTAGWWTDEQYAAFCEAYGYDVTEWSGFDVLRQTHELKMVSWLAQNVGESRKAAAEYRVRMTTLRTGDGVGRWRPL